VRPCGPSFFAAWPRRDERDHGLEDEKREAERKHAARLRRNGARGNEGLAHSGADHDPGDQESGERRLQPTKRVHASTVHGVHDPREAHESGGRRDRDSENE